jgi:uncharacterized protein (UPF0335 family)
MELAVAALERQKARIDAEIEAIRVELSGAGSAVRKTRPVVADTRRKRTPAERKAHSERMRLYWTTKRAQAGKPAASGLKTPAAGVKVRRKWTAAEKKALSLRMKEVWKRRAAAAKKSKT